MICFFASKGGEGVLRNCLHPFPLRAQKVGVGESSRLGFAARKTDCSAVLTFTWLDLTVALVARVCCSLPQNNNVVDIMGSWVKDIVWMTLVTLNVGRLSRISFVDSVVHAFSFGFT